MIHDLDATLKEFFLQKVPIDLNAIDLKFETPDQDWDAKPTKPTINLFLHDIRENHELRSNEQFLSRNGTTGQLTSAPKRIDLTYLITVWTRDIADEHRLLGTLLKTLLRYPTLPPEVLQGELVNPPLPLLTWVAQPEKTPNAWDFWSAIDGRMKAGISYGVTIAIQPLPTVEVDLVTEKVIKLQTQ